MKFPVIVVSVFLILFVSSLISCDKAVEDVIKKSSSVSVTSSADKKVEESNVKQVISSSSDLSASETGHHSWDHGGHHGSHGHHSKHGGKK